MKRSRSTAMQGGLGLAVLALVLAPAPAGAADAVTCHKLAATIVGTEGPDELVGTPGRDVFAGLGGDDRIVGDLTDDFVCGDEGDDTIIGSGPNKVWGGPGDDHLELTAGATDNYSYLYGEDGDDTLLGGPGNDGLEPGPGRDTVDGGAGVDRLFFDTALRGVSVNLARGVARGQGRDTVTGVEDLSGTRYADRLIGDDGPNYIGDYVRSGGGVYPPYDVVDGRGGDDGLSAGGGTLRGGSGDDYIALDYICCRTPVVDDHFDGGTGYDTIYFVHNQGPVTLDLQAGTATGPSIGDDVALGLEEAHGTSSNDTFLGNDEDNQFFGEYGDDRLDGRSGDDTLDGGYADDTLLGGPGTDTCRSGETVTECETEQRQSTLAAP